MSMHMYVRMYVCMYVLLSVFGYFLLSYKDQKPEKDIEKF
jgi:hypothetical protein